ncbi:MAG: hypothetical protein IT384_00935 [Deltaproteobacteria bacterium]|nr:hypothetical protein [Deltaproteobacteria bacterium]
MNARELTDRIDMIVFEGETARGWLQQLARRSAVALEAARNNTFFASNSADQLAELEEAIEACSKAEAALEALSAAAMRREGKAA